MEHARRRLITGFTLIELIVTMLVIAALAAIVIGVAGVAERKRAQGTAAASMEKIGFALEAYRAEYGRYPEDIHGEILDGNTEWVEWARTNKFPNLSLKDPWNLPYEYVREGPYSYRLYCAGPDGRADTYDDIVSGRDR